jgi:hypothetical protein
MDTAKDQTRRRLLKLNRETTSRMTGEQLETLVGGGSGPANMKPDSEKDCASITDCSYWFDVC